MSAILQLIVRQRGSQKDLGPFLNVVTWILLITSALAVLTRLVTKRALRRRIDVDDAFVVAALIASLGSGIAVSVQVSNGLGRDMSTLASDQTMAYEKSEYATKLLYIATLALAKLSIISLMMILTASDLHRRLGITLTAFIAVCGIGSELAAAFQCGIAEPWRSFGPGSNCFSLPAFWRVMGTLNMLTDVALILFPVHVIVTLQMSTSKKVTILTFFGARSLDVIATGIQIAWAPAFASPNPTRDLWKWTLTSQVIECITILTSCVPYLRPLLESIPSGMYGADELRRRGTPSELGYSRSKSVSYKLSSNSTTAGDTSRSKSQSETGIRRFLPTLPDDYTSHSNSASGLPGGPRRPDGEHNVEISTPKHTDDRRWETESTGSQAKIMKTTVMSAEWQETERKSRDESREVMLHH